MTPPTTRVVVQGSGNVGGIGARLLHESGYKVVAISDIHGGIYNQNGIDIPEALRHLQQTRSFDEYEGVERVNNSELLEIGCDVLVPAATENQITSKNADRIRCKVLAEGANGPTTAAARRRSRGEKSRCEDWTDLLRTRRSVKRNRRLRRQLES